jgi:hypothetical protein
MAWTADTAHTCVRQAKVSLGRILHGILQNAVNRNTMFFRKRTSRPNDSKAVPKGNTNVKFGLVIQTSAGGVQLALRLIPLLSLSDSLTDFILTDLITDKFVSCMVPGTGWYSNTAV